MAAHCSVDMAEVPESVSRSIRIASEGTRNRLYPADSNSRWRSSRVVVRIGSTLLMRNGSMMGRLLMLGGKYPSRHYHNLEFPSDLRRRKKERSGEPLLWLRE